MQKIRKYLTFRKIITSFVILISLFVLSLIVPPYTTKVDAQVYSCGWVNPWVTASWGRGKVCYIDGASWFKVKTDDILTDGYCVHAEYKYTANGLWYNILGSESCGPEMTTLAIEPAPYTVRLIRGPAHNPPNGIGV